MNQHMAFQIAKLIACVVALVATVGLLPTIKTLLVMFCNIVRLHFRIFPAKWYCARSKGN